MTARRQRGFTLIELLMSILIISIAVAGVLAVMRETVLHSADPAIEEQTVAIAEAYMDEIMAKEFADPDGVEGENRLTFDDVGDYNNLNQSPTDQNGNAIAALAGYNVNVTVGAAGAVQGENLRPIVVTVTHIATGIAFTLNGYRASW